MKSGNLNFLEPCGPLQACNGPALPLPFLCCVLNGTVLERQLIFNKSNIISKFSAVSSRNFITSVFLLWGGGWRDNMSHCTSWVSYIKLWWALSLPANSLFSLSKRLAVSYPTEWLSMSGNNWQSWQGKLFQSETEGRITLIYFYCLMCGRFPGGNSEFRSASRTVHLVDPSIIRFWTSLLIPFISTWLNLYDGRVGIG